MPRRQYLETLCPLRITMAAARIVSFTAIILALVMVQILVMIVEMIRGKR